jgi:long-chain acyl-CoA synthetase
MGQYRTTLNKLTTKELLEHSVQNYRDRDAMGIIDKEMLTYGELYDRVNEMTHLLKTQGIKKGDKVAILSENLPYWGVAYFAISQMGAVVVPILPDFHASEVHHILNHSEAKAIFVSQRYVDVLYEEFQSQVKSVILVDTLKIVEDLTKIDTFKTLINKGKELLRVKHEDVVEEDDLLTILYTSGTTGSSKGVMLTHKNIISNVYSTQSVIVIYETDTFLSILPMAHTYECTVGFFLPLFSGASINYIEKPPTPKILLDAMAKVKPTIMLSVPLVIEKIFKARVLPNLTKNALMQKLYDMPFIRKKLHAVAGKKLHKSFGGRLRLFGIGGAKLSAQVDQFLDEAKFPYTIGYGLTETSPLLAATPPQTRKLRSTGPSIDGVTIKIDPETKEILAQGPNVMVGYYKDEERTKEVIDEDGWFHTGDLGYLDDDGYLFIEGRSKNVIIGPSGENIYPESIEATINEHPMVVESVVYDDEGKLHAKVHLDYEKLDELYHAEQVADSQMHMVIEELLEEIRVETNTKVSNFSKIMKFVEQKEPFIKTATKKIKRFLYTNN